MLKAQDGSPFGIVVGVGFCAKAVTANAIRRSKALDVERIEVPPACHPGDDLAATGYTSCGHSNSQARIAMTNRHALLLMSVVAVAAVPAAIRAQRAGYPITIVAPGNGSYTFPPGYQTPWDRIQIMVTAKMSPNLFVLHGSEGLDPAHPDASGGRVMVLFGPDGVVMVDTEHSQVAEKTLAAIRSFTNAPIKAL